jgi:hypothetical protein
MARYDLQKPRLVGDFNGLFGDILCLSHGDTCRTVDGDEVTLHEGMIVTVFDDDANNLVATGVVERSAYDLSCRGSVWCLQIDENGVWSESDIQELEDAEQDAASNGG